MTASGLVILRSNTGREFTSVYEVEDTGELTLMTKTLDGYKSAHRMYAMAHFGGSVIRTEHHTFINRHGFRMVLTCWKAKR